MVNLLVLPGLGSFLGHHRVSGIAQVILSLAGFGLTVLWSVTFISAWFHTKQFPADGGPYLRWGLIGLGLFLAGWLWALASSLQILRQSRRSDL